MSAAKNKFTLDDFDEEEDPKVSKSKRGAKAAVPVEEE